jgi:hypothetical protein
MERNIVPRRWLRLGSANAHPTTGRLNERTLHLNSQRNGLDNGVHLRLLFRIFASVRALVIFLRRPGGMRFAVGYIWQ